MTLENAIITSYNVQGSGDTCVPRESFSFSYTKIEIKYFEMDEEKVTLDCPGWPLCGIGT